jgi:hypothetical protein
MKKLPENEKACRISTSIPAELNEWIELERVRAAKDSAYSEMPSLASVVTRALYEYKRKIEERDQQDVVNMRNQVSEAAKKVGRNKK